MKSFKVLASIIIIVSVFVMCNKAGILPSSGYDDRLSGGAATVFDITSQAFTHEIEGLNARDLFCAWLRR